MEERPAAPDRLGKPIITPFIHHLLVTDQLFADEFNPFLMLSQIADIFHADNEGRDAKAECLKLPFRVLNNLRHLLVLRDVLRLRPISAFGLGTI